MRYTVPIVLLVLTLSCGQRQQVKDAPEAILAQMRADTAWIHQLDSMAQIAIGPGSKCLDPVSHSFAYDGRIWLFNQDWGGVLEIPADYTIEDDLWQAELSFHGTRVWSPDSLILISFYAGFQALENDEFEESTRLGLEEDGFAVQAWDEKEKDIIIRARSAEGINYYGRHRLANENGVEYSVSVQYPDGKGDDAKKVIDMANMYPTGPNGNVFKGEAL